MSDLLTPADEQIALILAPAREVPGWWICVCDECFSLWQYYGGGVSDSSRKAQANCNYARHPPEIRYYRYTGPPFSTSPVACFQWVTPVLLELGWFVTQGKEATSVQDDVGVTLVFEDAYATANTRALAWAHNNMPERLAEAVARVKEKNCE